MQVNRKYATFLRKAFSEFSPLFVVEELTEEKITKSMMGPPQIFFSSTRATKELLNVTRTKKVVTYYTFLKL